MAVTGRKSADSQKTNQEVGVRYVSRDNTLLLFQAAKGDKIHRENRGREH